MLIWYKILHYQCGFCAVSEKLYFLVYGAVFRAFTKSTLMVFHNFFEQKREYVIFLDKGEILEKGVHESNVCDTGVYRYPNCHIFKQFQFQIPYNLDHLFQFSITFNNSFLPFQFHYPSIFATCYLFLEIFTSFPFPPNRANFPFYPSIRSSSPTYFTSTFGKQFLICYTGDELLIKYN